MSLSDNAFEDAPRKGNWYPLSGHTKPTTRKRENDLNMKSIEDK